MKKITKALFVATALGMASLTQAATDWSTQDYDLYSGDFNYDGKSDILYVAKSPDKLSGLALGDASGGPNTPYQSWPSNYLGIDWSGNKYTPVIADFNCDHRADVLLQSNVAGGYSYLLFANSQGELTGIGQAVPSSYLGLTWTSDQHKLIAGDFNGDCRADLFFQATSPTGTHAVMYADGYGYFTATATESWTDSSNNMGLNWSTPKANVFAGDFNGDGRADLLVQAKPKFVMIDYDVTFPVPTYPPAMNGVALSQGGTTPFVSGAVQLWSRMNNGVDWSPLTNNVVVGDFNGDGRTDVILQAKYTGRTSYMLTGNASGAIFPTSATAMGSGANWSADSYKLIAGNFDGAGGAGIYFQALTSGGLNYYANTVTGSSVTATPQNSSQVTGAVPATSPGRTAGAFNVSSTGAATYSIPIWVPPGPKGIQPNLAISYNSQSGEDSMGPGWSIAGLPAITRCNKTYAQDSAPAAVALTESDGYCLNGNRLILTWGTYGQEGSYYETELRDFSSIRAHAVSGVQNGPGSFEVWGKDGLIYEYGNSADSRVFATNTSTVRQWLLNKVRDRAGNNYVVSYGTGASGSTGIGVPMSIAYTPTSAGASTYKYTVSFTYGSDTSQGGTEVGYVAGTVIKNTNLLTNITVTNGSTILRKYNFGYQVAPTTVRARLSTVQECAGSGGTDCLAPTTMTYSDGVAGVGAFAATPAPSGATLKAVCDLNGDRRDDILYTNSTGAYVMMADSSSPGFKNPTSLGASVDYASCADLAGTGQDDIVFIASNEIKRYRWNGASFDQSSLASTSYGWLALADVNGDGLPDILTAGDSGANNIYVRLNATSPGGPLTFSTTNTLAYTDPNAAAGIYGTYDGGSVYLSKGFFSSSLRSRGRFDFNGDGRQDILFQDFWWQIGTGASSDRNDYYALFSTASGFTATGMYSSGEFLSGGHVVSLVAVADFNNDNCSDVVYTTGDTSLSHVSACNGNPAAQGWLNRYLASLDWDGDGRSDHLVTNGANAGVLLSTGIGNSALVATSIPALSALSGVLFPLDVDGDGLDDLGMWIDGSGGGITYALHNAAGTPPDLVRSITDGYGVTIQPSYTSTAQSSYTKSSGLTSAAYKELSRPVNVVGQVTQSDGAGGAYTSTYSYTGAVESLQRGFAGFQSISVSDNRADSPVVKTYYRTDFPYTGMVSQQDVYQHDGSTLMSHTVNTPAANSGYGLYFPYVLNTTTETREVGGTKNGQLITSAYRSFTYDGYGSATTVTTTLTDKDSLSLTYNSSWTTAITNTITPNTSNWCLGLPTQVQVAYSSTVSNESAITRTVGFTPDYMNCRIDYKTVEPNGTYAVTYHYLYDPFGNVGTETVQGASMTLRTTTTGWGAAGQYPVTVTNAANEITTYGYDDRFGLQNSVTDPNGVTTAPTVFDSFGRKLTEYRTDGTSTAYNYYNCASVGCQNGDPGSGATSINRMVVKATAKDSTGTDIKDDWAYLDQFDRTIVTKSKTLSSGYSRVGTQYDALGRAWRQTVPCDVASCATYWITHTYDARGRITQQQRPISASNTTLQTSTVAYQGMTTVITDPQGKTATRIADPNGWLRRSQDHNGYYQSFAYDAFGSLKQVTDQSNTLFSANYVYGIGAFQTATTDIDLGTWGYTPNALGEVTAYTDARGNTITQSYDALSRPTSQSTTGETTRRWIWGSSPASHNVGQLQSVCLSSAADCSGATQLETNTYDNVGRLQQKDILADGVTYTYNYAYNTSGLLDTLTYPTSTSSYRLALKHLYQNGALQQVKDANASTVFWQANTANVRGQITQETLGNSIVTNRSFDPITGWINSIQSGVNGGTGVQNESYLFDQVGNVMQRQNNTLGLTENFYYDNLYRLDYSQLNGTTNLDMTYDAMGRITNRTDVASNAAWTYHATKKHAVTQAGNSSYTYTYDNNGNAITRNGQSIAWNNYNYPTVINGSATENVTLSYDANNQRWKQVYVNGSTTETTYYLGGLMEKVTTGSATDFRYYIYANGRAAVAVMSRLSSGTNTTRYMLEDHQDSVAKITDGSGNVTVSESFTAFGSRRSPTTWSGSPSGSDLTTIAGISRQGYTWQTALGNMGLNHMNGRVQDAITGRFLSADPYITEPTNTQNYNRYSYVYNNPLSFIDPSGFDGEQSEEKLEEIVISGSRDDGDYNSGDGSYIFRIDYHDRYIGLPTGAGISGALAAQSIRDTNKPLGEVLTQTQNPPCVLSGPTGQYTTAAGVDARFNSETSQMLSTALANLNQQGITPVITSGYRSPETQTALRNSNSPTVITPAQVSWHQVGAAVDFGPNSNAGNFNAIRTAMGQAGFVWGGNFRTPDTPHFQSQPAGTSPSAALVQSCARAGG